MSDEPRFSVDDVQREKEKGSVYTIFAVAVALLFLPFTLAWKLLNFCYRLVMVVPLAIVQTGCALLLAAGDSSRGGTVLFILIVQAVVLGVCIASCGFLAGLGLFVVIMLVVWPLLCGVLRVIFRRKS